MLQEGDSPTCSVVLYALAQDAGISWKGCAMVKRKHYWETLPKRTSAARLARRLGYHRHTVAKALRTLLRGGWIVPRYGRLEPVKARLYRRFRRAKPIHKLKIPPEALRKGLNTTDKLVLGKLAKCASQWGRRWLPKAWQLALDVQRHVVTVRRSLRKLKDLRLVSKTVAKKRLGYVFSPSPTHLQRLDEATTDPEGLLDALAARFRTRSPPDRWSGTEWEKRRRAFVLRHYGVVV